MSRTDRSYIFHEYTQSLCPDCLALIPAKIVIKESAVYLLKTCPTHGQQVELFEEDVDYFLHRRTLDKPGTACRVQTSLERGCPFDCGLCPDHDQHTCIGLIEVTNQCDLNCPICYADSGKSETLPLDVIEKMMDFYQDTEYGQADILQISGGEPTTHPQIIDIIRLAKSKKFRYVMLNTNGLRIARDDAFVQNLKELTGNFEIYFQFDGFSSQTAHYFRGQDVTALKQQALAKLAAHNIPTTMVTTVESGINDHELGHLIAYALQTPNIRGITFQPIAYFGRGKPPTSGRRITLSGVLTRLAEQTNGMLQKNDFVPLPCNVERVSITYLHRTENGFLPLLRNVDLKARLSLIRNSFAFDLDDYTRVAKDTGLLGDCCNLSFLGAAFAGPKQKPKLSSENIFRVTVNSFVDSYNFDMKSMQKECVHIITPDFKKIPFSAYNILHRGKYSSGNRDEKE